MTDKTTERQLKEDALVGKYHRFFSDARLNLHRVRTNSERYTDHMLDWMLATTKEQLQECGRNPLYPYQENAGDVKPLKLGEKPVK